MGGFMELIKSLESLHGKKSKCKKFTINIDKDYLAVACNFHDGKDRIVYSEPIYNVDTILYDLYEVWNYPKYKLSDEINLSDYGMILLVNKDEKIIARRYKSGGRTIFSSWNYYELFDLYDCWEDFVEMMIKEHECKIVSL